MNFIYRARNLIPQSQLIITSAVGTVITGKHLFLQPCPGAGQFIPTNGIIFDHITFEYTPSVNNEVMIQINGQSGGCGFTELVFSYCNFQLLPNTGGSTVLSGESVFLCNQCLLNNLVFIKVMMNAPSVTYTWFGIQVITTNSALPPLFSISSTVLDPPTQYIYINGASGFNITDNSITCSSSAEGGAICVQIVGSVGTVNAFQDNTVIITAGSNNTGFEWDLQSPYTFSQLGTLLVDILDNVMNSAGIYIGIRIIVPQIQDQYPCQNTTEQTIIQLTKQNPAVVVSSNLNIIITDPDPSVILKLLQKSLNNALNCFIFVPFPSVRNLITIYIVVSTIALLCFIGFLFVGLFNEIYDVIGWNYVINPEEKQQNSGRKIEIIDSKKNV